jgi:hypothetical protein
MLNISDSCQFIWKIECVFAGLLSENQVPFTQFLIGLRCHVDGQNSILILRARFHYFVVLYHSSSRNTVVARSQLQPIISRVKVALFALFSGYFVDVDAQKIVIQSVVNSD